MTTYYYRRINPLAARYQRVDGVAPDIFTFNGLEHDEVAFGFAAALDDFDKGNLDTVLTDSGYTYHHSEDT